MNLTTEAPMFIAIDPGLTSGWALYNTLDGTFASGEIEGRPLLYRFLENVMDDGQPMHLIVERFDIGAGTVEKTRQLDALYIIGALEYLAGKTGAGFTVQSRASAKTFATDDKLKALGWWFRGGEGHANDAGRHLLAWMVESGALGTAVIVGQLVAELV